MTSSNGPVTDGSLVFRAGEPGTIVQETENTGTVLSIEESMPSLFRKTALTRAVRIPGPFTVETSEGPLRCEDGYLAVDARGYPYPIAADEFVRIYEPVASSTGQENRHPAVDALLRFFAFEHLPAHLQAASRPFAELAATIANGPQNAEATTALRKLLEAKDCAVRAALPS